MHIIAILTCFIKYANENKSKVILNDTINSTGGTISLVFNEQIDYHVTLHTILSYVLYLLLTLNLSEDIILISSAVYYFQYQTLIKGLFLFKVIVLVTWFINKTQHLTFVFIL